MADPTQVEPVLRLAEEFAVQFRHRPIGEVATMMAEHIRKFWDPRMRRALVRAVDAGADTGEDVRAAAALLQTAG